MDSENKTTRILEFFKDEGWEIDKECRYEIKDNVIYDNVVLKNNYGETFILNGVVYNIKHFKIYIYVSGETKAVFEFENVKSDMSTKFWWKIKVLYYIDRYSYIDPTFGRPEKEGVSYELKGKKTVYVDELSISHINKLWNEMFWPLNK